MLEALIAAAPAAGIRIEISPGAYRGAAPVLMTYGTGHPVRRPSWQKHRAKGGRCIGWDLGYWHHRENGTFTMRATLDEDHPQAFIRPEPGERWDSQGIELREEFDPAGPIILVGMGPKAWRVHGTHKLQWETGQAVKLKKQFPGRRILYRPKKYGGPSIRGFAFAQRGPIEDAIRGASLIVCRHSNVAVDACIAGIPVICEDGAAAALYSRGSQPTREQRLEFLRSLAWWQWKPEEATEAWKYLSQRLSG